MKKIIILIGFALILILSIFLVFFNKKESIVTIKILKMVIKKQNKTNFVSQISLKSNVAKSLNSNTGNGIKKTNLFIFDAKTSSIIPIFLNNIPNIIIAKTGTVAFKLKIKFSIISSLKKKPHKRLNLHMRLSYIYFFLHL